MPEREEAKLVLVAAERVMSRIVGEPEDPMTERWELSSPIPGVRVINTWQIYHGIWLALTKTATGHYQIYRSIDLQKYRLVHDHNTEIYNLFWLDDGHMLFLATDGWWKTTSTGASWSELDLGEPAPAAKSLATIPLTAGKWQMIAYGQDRKIYVAEYPGGTWAEAYDASRWLGKWYPAIAGSAAGILAGAGDKLIRSMEKGAADTWQEIHELDGTVKNIVASNQSKNPTFLIVVEAEDGQTEKFYRTYDLGDSIESVISRMDSTVAVASVTPTGQSDISTTFAVLGKRQADGKAAYKLLTEEG
jgi:hypothetical protein